MVKILSDVRSLYAFMNQTLYIYAKLYLVARRSHHIAEMLNGWNITERDDERAQIQLLFLCCQPPR